MTNTQEFAPHSIAVALPAYLKSLVERMLQGVLREQADGSVRWYLSESAQADVTLRMIGDGSQAISPNLRADVRRHDGSIESLLIEGPWRTGALAAALARIGQLLQAGAGAAAVAAHLFLQRWSENVASAEPRLLELRVGNRVIALLDPIQYSWHALDRSAPAEFDALLDCMAQQGWSLHATQVAVIAAPAAAPLKPLLWKFGLRAGAEGVLPAVRRMPALRLKGWPYFAAGGARSYADLIAQLRGGSNDHASLQRLALAPRAAIDGFLNACYVCEFFHGNPVPALPAARPGVDRGAGAVTPAPSAQRAVISAIRRSLRTE